MCFHLVYFLVKRFALQMTECFINQCKIDFVFVMFSECLTHFTEVEELEETELYMCTGCKKKQRSTKKFWIRRLPNVRLIHVSLLYLNLSHKTECWSVMNLFNKKK